MQDFDLLPALSVKNRNPLAREELTEREINMESVARKAEERLCPLNHGGRSVSPEPRAHKSPSSPGEHGGGTRRRCCLPEPVLCHLRCFHSSQSRPVHLT
ncbi:hypothetical protein ANANG_G00301440 [Anguilla anguilla]|uniref:Uncharacterized protein n=1 Tax=Anguilla anguilla TaxID=7936 RepID=A0A9D3LMT9_ANGAN|nr:hypothetical protein ANANG_G00301440 [Anguilla anguilla]